MCEYFSLKVFSKNDKSEFKIKVWFHFHQNKAYAKHSFACFCEFFKDRCLVYFCTDCYELSQFVCFLFFFFHLLLKDIFEVCCLVSVAIFAEVYVRPIC